MSKPIISVTVDSFLPRWDGVSRALVEWLPRMTQWYDFRVIVPDYGPGRPRFDGVEYHLFPLLPWIRIEGAGLPIYRASNIERALAGSDILWTHSIAGLAGKVASIAKRHSIPVISMVHSVEWEVYARNLPVGRELFERLWLLECRRRYRGSTRMVTPSQATADILRDANFENQISVVPLGVDTERFSVPTTEERAKFKTSLGFKPESFVFGYLGRFGAEKNIPLLFKAFEQLQRPDTGLLVVGGEPATFDTLQTSQEIRIFGSTSVPEDFYRAMDAFVLPSWSESAPLSILEAMSCGVVPLSTPVGNVPTYLDETLGFLFSPSSVDDLTTKMSRVLSESDHLATRRGRVRTFVEDNFDWNTSAQAIHAIVNDVLSASG